MKRIQFSVGCLFFLSIASVSYLFAQETKTQVIIIEEYVDENGEVQRKKTVHEGESLEEMEEQLQEVFPKGDMFFPFGNRSQGGMQGLMGGAWLGVQMEDDNVGVRIAEIIDRSPAQSAGLRDGDIIMKIDDLPVSSPQDVVNIINDHEPNDIIAITVDRESKIEVVEVVLGAQESPFGPSNSFFDNEIFRMDQEELMDHLGIELEFPEFENMEEFEYFGLYPNAPKLHASVQNHSEKGVSILSIEDNSVLKDSDIQEGDVITKMNDQEISEVEDLKKTLRDMKWGDEAEIEYTRGQKTKSTTVQFVKPEKPRSKRIEKL